MDLGPGVTPSAPRMGPCPHAPCWEGSRGPSPAGPGEGGREGPATPAYGSTFCLQSHSGLGRQREAGWRGKKKV